MKIIIKNKKLLSKFYYLFIIGYVLIAFIIASFSIGIFGFNAYTNSSDSMDPIIKKGSVIIVHSQTEYKIGDIISYHALINDKEEIIAHRIVDMGGNVYLTKGDSNQFVDREKVIPRLIIGKVIIIFPNLGFIINNLNNRIIIDLIFILPAAFIIFKEVKKIITLLHSKKIRK